VNPLARQQFAERQYGPTGDGSPPARKHDLDQ
jgi:hypothetical protein